MPELQSAYHPPSDHAKKHTADLFPRVFGSLTVRGRMRFDPSHGLEDFPPSALDIPGGLVASLAWDAPDKTGAVAFVATLDGHAGASSCVVQALETLALEVEGAIGFDLVQWEPGPPTGTALGRVVNLPNGAVAYLKTASGKVYFRAGDRERTEKMLGFAVGPVELGPDEAVGAPGGNQRVAEVRRSEPSPTELASPPVSPAEPRDKGARLVKLTEAARVVLIDGEPVGLSVDLTGPRSREALFAETEKAFAERFPEHCLWPVRWLGKRPILWSRPNGDSLAFADVRRRSNTT